MNNLNNGFHKSLRYFLLDDYLALKKHSFYGEFLLKHFILLFKDKKTNELEFLNSFNLLYSLGPIYHCILNSLLAI